MTDPSRKAISRAIYESTVERVGAALPMIVEDVEGARPTTYATAMAYALLQLAARLAFLAHLDVAALQRYLGEQVKALGLSVGRRYAESATAQAIQHARTAIAAQRGSDSIIDKGMSALAEFEAEVRRKEGA